MSTLGKVFRPRSVTILPKRPPDGTLKTYAILSTSLPFKDKFQLDVTRSQKHSRQIAISENPVEEGFTATNHARRIPVTLEIDGILTDTPTGLALLNVKETFAGVYRNLAQQNYQKLKELMYKREPVFVATSVDVYENMLITSLDVAKNSGTGYALEVSLQLREIYIRSPLNIPPILDLDGAVLGGGETQNIGTQSTTVTDIPGV
jgi:hypothetical protein